VVYRKSSVRISPYMQTMMEETRVDAMEIELASSPYFDYKSSA